MIYTIFYVLLMGTSLFGMDQKTNEDLAIWINGIEKGRSNTNGSWDSIDPNIFSAPIPKEPNFDPSKKNDIAILRNFKNRRLKPINNNN